MSLFFDFFPFNTIWEKIRPNTCKYYIKKYSLLDHGFKKFKMKRELEDANKETDIIYKNNKRKCILAKPIFSC